MDRDYTKDIADIKNLMESRSRFLSLSGLSGILSGTYALVGAALAHYIVYRADTIAYRDVQSGLLTPIVLQLLTIAFVVLILALCTAFYFTRKKAKRKQETIWTKASYNTLKSFSIPIITGGFFVLFLLYRGDLLLVASATLIFYGLALCAASNYTYRDIGTLGLSEIILGLLALWFSGYGLYFWAFGFGVLHIVYGCIMYFKYDRADA